MQNWSQCKLWTTDLYKSIIILRLHLSLLLYLYIFISADLILMVLKKYFVCDKYILKNKPPLFSIPTHFTLMYIWVQLVNTPKGWWEVHVFQTFQKHVLICVELHGRHPTKPLIPLYVSCIIWLNMVKQKPKVDRPIVDHAPQRIVVT